MDDSRIIEILGKLKMLESEKQRNGYSAEHMQKFLELLELLKIEFDTNNIILSDSFCSNMQEEQKVKSKECKHQKVIKGGKCQSNIKKFQYQVFEETE